MRFSAEGKQLTHEIGGFLNVGERLAINGDNTTIQGAGGTTASEIEADGGITIANDVDLTVNDLKMIDANVVANTGTTRRRAA